MELQFCPQPPHDAAAARAAMDEALERALHLFLLNRGVLVTPFHNMLLVPPMAGADDVAAVAQALDDFLAEVTA
jgi:glutamate-1-semialdehyde 2,1-aminomutase